MSTARSRSRTPRARRVASARGGSPRLWRPRLCSRRGARRRRQGVPSAAEARVLRAVARLGAAGRARRRAAVLDAELARNESRALFSAVREARRKETLRVFSSQWQRYVARRGVGRAAVALADRVLRRRRQTASFREWRDSAATALDEATANDALAEKHDRARTRRVDRSARLATVGAWRAAVSAARKVRADAVRAEVFFRTVSRRTFQIRFSGWASAARASHYKVSGRALMIRRAERAELFTHRLVLRRKRETFTAYRRVVAGAKRTRRRVGALVAKRVRNATVPAFRAWAETAWELRRRRAFGARMSSKSARRTSVTAFIAWRDATKARRLARRLERRADASPRRARARASLFAALAAWTDAFRYRRSVATFVRLARRRARRRAATGALARWRVAIATARACSAPPASSPSRGTRAAAARRRFDDWRLRAAERGASRLPACAGARARREDAASPPRGASCAAGRGTPGRRPGACAPSSTRTSREDAWRSRGARRAPGGTRRATRETPPPPPAAPRRLSRAPRAAARLTATRFWVGRARVSPRGVPRRASRLASRRERREARARWRCGARASRTSPPRDSPWTPPRAAAIPGRRGGGVRVMCASRRRSRGASAARPWRWPGGGARRASR